MKLSSTLTSLVLSTVFAGALAQANSAPALSSPTNSAPGDAMKEIERGRKLSLSKQWQEASKYFQKAIALNPRLPEAYYEDGIAQMELGHFKEALNDCDQALSVESTCDET